MIAKKGLADTTVRDDRILPETRVVAALVIPFLLLAFGVRQPTQLVPSGSRGRAARIRGHLPWFGTKYGDPVAVEGD